MFSSLSKLLPSLFLLCLVSCLSACSILPGGILSGEKSAEQAGEHSDKPSESAGSGMPPSPVVVAPVEKSMVRFTDSFVGTVKARRSVIIHSQVEGCITNIYVQSGDVVKKGAPLFEVDIAKQKEALASKLATRESLLDEKATAQERLKSLLAERQARVSNLDFMKSQYERYRGLKAEGAVAQESVDQYFNQLKGAEADLASSDAQIKGQEALIRKAEKMLKESQFQAKQEEVQLSRHTAQAPFDGVVGDVPVRLGQYVDTSSELTTIDQNHPLEVYVYVPADQVHKLKLGLPIELLDVAGKLIGSCPITFISPEVGRDDQVVLVKGLFDNPQDKLRSNQQITARLIWQRAERALVPTTSIMHISGQDFVFVARPAEKGGFVARQLPVSLGDIQNNCYVVLSGLKDDDKVVVSDVQRLFEGAPVVPSERTASGAGAKPGAM